MQTADSFSVFSYKYQYNMFYKYNGVPIQLVMLLCRSFHVPFQGGDLMLDANNQTFSQFVWLLGSWDILSCLRILQISMLSPHLPASLVNQLKGVARVQYGMFECVHTNMKNKFQKTPKAVMFFLLIFLVLCIWTYLFSTCLLIESSVIFGFCDPKILGSHSACGIQLPYSQVI